MGIFSFFTRIILLFPVIFFFSRQLRPYGITLDILSGTYQNVYILRKMENCPCNRFFIPVHLTIDLTSS